MRSAVDLQKDVQLYAGSARSFVELIDGGGVIGEQFQLRSGLPDLDRFRKFSLLDRYGIDNVVKSTSRKCTGFGECRDRYRTVMTRRLYSSDLYAFMRLYMRP